MRITVLTVPGDAVEVASDRLFTAGARAIEERDTADGKVELRTVLAADDDLSTGRVGLLPSVWSLTFEDGADVPSEAWRDYARPIRVSDRLIVTPAWCDVFDPGHALVIPIEPAGSFGLGDHPTTRLSAGAVDRIVRSGDTVLDVGCGSGVLGILAALRGASQVIGLDTAEAAVEATVANSELNGVGPLVTASSDHPSSLDGPFSLVVANILAPILIQLSGELVRLTAPDGRLVISGILASHHDHVLEALAPMVPVATDELEGWVAVELRYPSTIGR